MKPSSKLVVTSVSDQVVQPAPKSTSVKAGRFEVAAPQYIPIQHWESFQKAPLGYIDIVRAAGPVFRPDLADVRPVRALSSKAPPSNVRNSGHAARVRRRVTESAMESNWSADHRNAGSHSSVVATVTSNSSAPSANPASATANEMVERSLASVPSSGSLGPTSTSTTNMSSQPSAPPSTATVATIPPTSSAIAVAAAVFPTVSSLPSSSASGTTPAITSPAAQPQPTVISGSLLASMPVDQSAQYLKQFTTAQNAINHLKATLANFGKGLGIQPPPLPVLPPAAPNNITTPPSNALSSEQPQHKDTAPFPASVLEELEKLREENSQLRKNNHKFANEIKGLKQQLEAKPSESAMSSPVIPVPITSAPSL